MVRVAVLMFWILLGAAPAEGGSDAAAVDSLLSAAADTSLSHMRRVDLMESAVRRDRTGRAMHALGAYYLSQNTVLSRQFARQWLRRAMRREPDNAAYRMTYAELFRQAGDKNRFYEQVREVVDLDPNNVEALYWAGRHAAREMMLNLERETLHTGPERKRRFNYGEYGRQMRDQAVSYLARVLSIEPDHRPARMLLGQVYLEGHMANRLVDLFKGYMKRHPDDWEAYFFVGLGHQEEQELEKAFASYAEGLGLLSHREQQFMKSIVLLADRETLALDGKLPDEEDLRRFWQGRDPLFLTPSNERLMEHCRRVAYANLRFGDPERGVEGWETDRGQVYIRYGHPGSRNLYLDRMNYVLLRETWSYPGFSVTFERISDTHWKVLEVWIQGSARSKLKDLLERVKEHYEDPYWLKRYDVPYQAAQFRDADGETRVELYYALPGEEVGHRDVRSGVQAVDLKQGLFLFDAEWQEVQKRVETIRQMPWIEGNAVKEGFLFWGERLALASGTYHLAVEVEDQKARTLGTFRDSLQVRRFDGNRLEVSGLLIAQRVVEQDGRPFGRDRFMVLPNPMKQCPRDGSIAFYFELYNLERDEFGATHYRVTYQTRLLPEKWMTEGGIPEWTTAVTNTYRDTRAWQPLYLTLDMQGATPGPWAFRVVVEDLHSGQQAMGETVFRVMP